MRTAGEPQRETEKENRSMPLMIDMMNESADGDEENCRKESRENPGRGVRLTQAE